MLRQLIREAQKKVIKALQEKEAISELELKVYREYFFKKISQIAQTGLSEEQKLEDEDVYANPLALAYLMYCYPIPLKSVIKDKEKLQEYWDFYLETYPKLLFDSNMQVFYELVKKQYKK